MEKRKIMNFLKNNKKKVAAVSIAALMLTIGCVNAFFTDSNELINTFKPGGISSELTEEKYDKEGEAQRINIAPNKVMVKDPKVKNIDTLDMYTFVKVTVPTSKVATFDETSGKKIEAKKQPLFVWETGDGWTLIKTVENNTTTDLYYAYGTSDKMTTLKPQESTSSVFKNDQIKFINIIEGQGIENTTLDFNVKDLSIQTTDLGKTAPLDILEIILQQRG